MSDHHSLSWSIINNHSLPWSIIIWPSLTIIIHFHDASLTIITVTITNHHKPSRWKFSQIETINDTLKPQGHVSSGTRSRGTLRGISLGRYSQHHPPYDLICGHDYPWLIEGKWFVRTVGIYLFISKYLNVLHDGGIIQFSSPMGATWCNVGFKSLVNSMVFLRATCRVEVVFGTRRIGIWEVVCDLGAAAAIIGWWWLGGHRWWLAQPSQEFVNQPKSRGKWIMFKATSQIIFKG